MKFNKFTETAIDAAALAGKKLLHYYNKKIQIDFKGKIDPVTVADRSSQEIILKKLKKSFPSHGYLSEEDKNPIISDEYCWVIDPLDGTVNFIHGVPVFCVSIALMYKGDVVSGVIYSPIINETFVAEKGKGAWLNGKRIFVSDKDSLLRSLVVTGFPYYVHDKPKKVIDSLSKVIVKAQGIRRLGSAALDLAYVACGRFEAFWEEGLAPWDVAAGSLIVKEARGRVTDFKNKEKYIFGRSVLATNGLIHNKMLRLIN